MQKKYYEIEGKSYTLREICTKYDVSRITFLRHIEKGMTVEEAVQKNGKFKDYKKDNVRREVNYPSNLVTDIIENCGIDILNETGKFDLDEIISNFEKRLKKLYEENRLSFSEREKEIIDKYYRLGYNTVEIAKDYEITKQRAGVILKQYFNKFKKKVFLKYILEDLEKMPKIKL